MIFRAAGLALALALANGAAGFTYDPVSDIGPGNWKSLTIPNNDCGGKENSPVAIEDRDCDKKMDYKLEAGTCTFKDMIFTVNDHGVKAEFDPASSCTKPTMVIPDRDGVWEALQFHIHTGSEHTVDGVTYGAEMHIVHQMQNCPADTKRCFAVMGTKLNPASNLNDNEFTFFMEGWIMKHNEQETACSVADSLIEYTRLTTDDTPIDPYQFNRGDDFFHYEGGLTTPPCSEVVVWNLDTKAQPISPEQYTNLAKIILFYRDPATCEKATVAYHGSTSRPTQPLHGRDVIKICSAAS